MAYKKQVIILGSAATVLAVIFVLSLVFDPARRNARHDRFAWFPAASRIEADRIDIIRDGERIELVLMAGRWFLVDGTLEIPVRQGRVDDLLRILSTRGAFPRRGASAASHAQLGLDGFTRIIIRRGAGVALLDLLVGIADPSGTEVFLRRAGENEFRSGNRLIATYIHGSALEWSDLRFFDDSITLAHVQRVQVHFFAEGTGYTISRSGAQWLMDGVVLDQTVTESWLRRVLGAQGSNFSPRDPDAPVTAAAVMRLELGDGSAIDIQIGETEADDTSFVLVGGASYLLVISSWTSAQLVPGREHFQPAE